MQTETLSVSHESNHVANHAYVKGRLVIVTFGNRVVNDGLRLSGQLSYYIDHGTVRA